VLASPLVPTHPLHFHYVGLDEPDKAAVLTYASTSASFQSTVLLPWHALVIARADGQSRKLLVDISDASAPSVLLHAVHHGAGFPMMTTADQVAAICAATHVPSLRGVGVAGRLNVSDIGCGVLSRGWFGAKGKPDAQTTAALGWRRCSAS
jgi:primary-amine oxidase